MENEVLRYYFERKADELLNDTSHYERVFINLGKFSVNIVKVFDDLNHSEINYIYDNETIKTSSPRRDDIISSLIELNYYPEIKLQELSSQSEINRKKKLLIEEIYGDIDKVCEEFKPLHDKIDLYVKLYGEDNLEEKISLFMLEEHMSYINTKLKKGE